MATVSVNGWLANANCAPSFGPIGWGTDDENVVALVAEPALEVVVGCSGVLVLHAVSSPIDANKQQVWTDLCFITRIAIRRYCVLAAAKAGRLATGQGGWRSLRHLALPVNR